MNVACQSIFSTLVFFLPFRMIQISHYVLHGFVEVPSNQTLTYPPEMVASFRCHYESPQARINWLVNGTVFRGSSQSDIKTTYIRHDNGSETGVLTIPNSPQYSGTQIVCEASLAASREVTPVAILTVVKDTQNNITTTEMINLSFNEVPSPMLMIVTLREQHTYTCSHSAAERITWRVNDMVLGADIVTIPGIEYTDSFSNPDDAVYTLTIRALPQHNETTIQCTAIFQDEAPQRSPTVAFLIQGQLQRVSNLERNGSIFLWQPPFSLNLTGVDPDIVYCVEMYNITCGRKDVIASDCNVTEPSYTSDDITSHGYIYEYTVTPRSNVKGASNGTSLTVTEKFVILGLSSKQHTLSIMDDISKVMVTFHLDILGTQNLLVQSRIHADLYTISLNSIDGLRDIEEKQVPSDVIMNNGSVIIFQVPLLFRRLWIYTLFAHGCDEHPVMNATYLSTHDIQEIIITSLRPGEIRVTGTFIEGSTATGVLVAALSNSIRYFYLLERENFSVGLDDTISNIADGQHIVTVFVMKKNGLPVHGTATIPQSVMVVKGGVNQSLPIEYQLQSSSTGVCITCTFLDSSPTYCVAVVHQQISQFSSSGLMNIESSHMFNRSGDTAYGCIKGFNLKDHHVGVIGGREKQLITPPSKTLKLAVCTASCVVGILVAFLVTILLLTTFVCCVAAIPYVLRKRKYITGYQQSGDPSDNVNIKLQKCGAYEVVQLSRQTVTMNDNPAYGEIGVGEYAIIT